MAELIPSLNTCLPRMQSGEKRFAERLKSHLEDDYLCWYELPVGKRQRYSDFIVLHPGRGLLLLEVKDWKLDTIAEIDHVSVKLRTSNGSESASNPLAQVRQCAYQLVNRLKQDPQLVHSEGRYVGNLLFPYGYGVVLSNITRRDFNNTDMKEVLPEHKVICKDEMFESVDPETFQERLWNMFDYRFQDALSLPQVDRIRWHLFPEIRIDSAAQISLFDEDITSVMPNVVEVMDRQQEQLARNLGEGHRVVHGVAGSGKTLILCYRCVELAERIQKPILVLCYNISLAARLREAPLAKGFGDQINVYHFHEWCGEQLKLYHIDRPTAESNYFEALVAAVTKGVDKGQIPSAQYGAVMIDEGHDFEADWLRLAVRMVEPETGSLLLLYDDAQSIYSKKKQLSFSLSSVGIKASGRTTILKLNYRNTVEIMEFARHFARQYFDKGKSKEDDIPLVEPESIGKVGPGPVVKQFSTYKEESEYLAWAFEGLHKRDGNNWSQMCIAYRNGWMGEQLQSAFKARGIPCHWLRDRNSKRQLSVENDSVKIMTMHSSKGLEFPIVAVSGVGRMPDQNGNEVDEAKLLYVAMTRATEKLIVTADRQSDFLTSLKKNKDTH